MFVKSKPKIFCISFQRTGTTSVGRFFKDHGYKVAGYDKNRSATWSYLKFIGDYEKIFNSKAFKSYQVFEDNPWWEGDFYRVLYHRFPNSKFILFTRNSDKWFDSMVSHSKGKTLGNTFLHVKNYRREEEFYRLYPELNHYSNILQIDNLLDLNESNRGHYKAIYELRNKEVIDFFSFFDSDRIIHLELEDPDKWKKLAGYFSIKLSSNYNVHLNKSN